MVERGIKDLSRPNSVRLLDNHGGFSYLTLLFIITIIGIAAAAAGQVWSTMAKREAEEELLFRGTQIMKAIEKYYEESPGTKSYPPNLDVLVKDPRYPAKRYLRRLYADPMTGKIDWEIIRGPDGGVMGVKSKDCGMAYKKSNFPKELIGFDGKSVYCEWDFMYVPKAQQQKK